MDVLPPVAPPSLAWMTWAQIDYRLPFHLRRWVYRSVYLRSRHWRRVRAAWWSRFPYRRCGYCGQSWGRMDLHHVTYSHLGAERAIDLVPVHRTCHQRVHRHG